MKQTKLPEIARISNPSYAAVVSDSLHANKIAMQARVKEFGSMRCDPSRLYLVLINRPALAARAYVHQAQNLTFAAPVVFLTQTYAKTLAQGRTQVMPKTGGLPQPTGLPCWQCLYESATRTISLGFCV